MTSYSRKLWKIVNCPECGSDYPIEDYDRGEIICQNCGLVINEDIMDRGPEWRAFDDEQRAKRTRVGTPITYTIHDRGLSTTINWSDKRSIGGKISSKQRLELYALRKRQRQVRVLDATEKNLAVALSQLSKLSSTLNLPRSVVETASVIYRKAVKKKISRGRSIHSMIAATIYLSCRKCGIPRTLEEIATTSSLSRKDLARSYRFIIKELDSFVPLLTSSSHASRLSNKLAISGRAEIIAIKILGTAKKMKLTSGRGPLGMAAAATYLATVLTNERKPQREIAEIANVTEVTIRNRYKELLERLLIEIEL